MRFRRAWAVKGLLGLLLMLVLVIGVAATAPSPASTTTILFTHDLHSHFLPQATDEGGESGGYARLETVIAQKRAQYPDALLVDGGDFSIGSLIQTLYTTQAPELRTMGAMGFEVTTAGNHEFDHTGIGFAQMLNSAVASGEKTPALLMANYKPSDSNPDQLVIQRAMAAYGVKDYMLLERGGVTYGLFGLMGTDSDDCAPASGFTLEDPIKSAQRCVDALKELGAEFIICLSHSGTDEKVKLSEDEQLAEKVSGIDVIVSGHTHTTLEEPIVVNDTYIVSAGAYCENLGSITLSRNEDTGEKSLLEYELIPIDETISGNPEIEALAEKWKSQVGGTYLTAYDLTYDQVLTESAFDVKTPESGVQTGNALGELVSDSFLWALEQAEGDIGETVAVTAEGVLRASLHAGPITTSMAFDVLSLGVGNDGTSGYPLVSVWLTGKELGAMLEVDASVTPIMSAAQLYISGMDYSFNTHRMFFNRVTEAKISAGGGAEIEEEKLYRVVTGMYSAQMLSTVKGKSMGLLSLIPKDQNGEPITDFTKQIVYDKNGNEVKEWYALASYLANFGGEGVPARYAAPDGRKDVSGSWNPIELFKHPNWITLAALLVLVLVAALVIFLVRKIFVSRKRRRFGGYRRRRF